MHIEEYFIVTSFIIMNCMFWKAFKNIVFSFNKYNSLIFLSSFFSRYFRTPSLVSPWVAKFYLNYCTIVMGLSILFVAFMKYFSTFIRELLLLCTHALNSFYLWFIVASATFLQWICCVNSLIFIFTTLILLSQVYNFFG